MSFLRKLLSNLIFEHRDHIQFPPETASRYVFYSFGRTLVANHSKIIKKEPTKFLIIYSSLDLVEIIAESVTSNDLNSY